MQRIGGVHQSAFTGSLALALLGSVLASCITPYGPGLLAYDVGGVAQRPDRAVHQRVELTELPLGHDAAPLLHPPGRARGVHLDAAPARSSRSRSGCFSSWRRCRPSGSSCTCWSSRPALAATLPARAPGGRGHGAGRAGGWWSWPSSSSPSRRCRRGRWRSTQPVRRSTSCVRTPAGSSREYTWGDYSVARHRATFVDGRTDLFEGEVLTEFMAVTNLTTNPDPVLSASHVDYVVWAPHTPLASLPGPRPALARGGPHLGGRRLRPSLRRARCSPEPGRPRRPRVAVLVAPGLERAVARPASRTGRSRSACRHPARAGAPPPGRRKPGASVTTRRSSSVPSGPPS